ncbi:MAG: GIY-YIG nuclease family protein [Opitutaceae bacterium]|nr:GIY-YIG nuclease family protein [Opitutaceae bacterium]
MPAKRAFVYILRCADRTFYIGTAKNVQLRLAVHNAGKGAKYTRPRLPVRVVWQEGPLSLTRALQREYQLKQLTRPFSRWVSSCSCCCSPGGPSGAGRWAWH